MGREKGFTLIEILVSLAIASVVSTAIYATYTTQHRIYMTQKQIADIQQNLRTCIYLLEEEIKHACYDPTGTAGPSIRSAGSEIFRFQCDLNENGHAFSDTATVSSDDSLAGSGTDPHEDISYSLSTKRTLRRATWGMNADMADHIEALDFVYFNQAGERLAPLPLTTENMAAVRAVEVTLIARSERPDPGHRDTKIYRNLRGDTLISGSGDHYHRRSLSKVVYLRNIPGARP